MSASVEQGKDVAGNAQDKKAKRLKEARQQKAQDNVLRLETLIDLFLAHIDNPKNTNKRGRPYADKTRREYRQHLLTHFSPEFGNAVVEEMSPKAIKVWLKKKATKTPSQANHIMSAISAMFAWAVHEDMLDSNPVAGMKKPGGKQQSKTRALDYNHDLQEVIDSGEIRQFWTGLDELNPLHRLAVRMVLLTAQRPGEVMSAEWAHIIDDRWIIPASHTKNKKAAHKVPITPMLQTLLDELRTLSGDTPYLFPQARWADKKLLITRSMKTGEYVPIDPSTVSKAMSRTLTDMEPFTTHDLRRTASTHMQFALNYSLVDIGVLLNHSAQGVTAIYARGVNIDKLRIMLEAWQDHLQSILDNKKKKSSKVRRIRG